MQHKNVNCRLQNHKKNIIDRHLNRIQEKTEGKIKLLCTHWKRNLFIAIKGKFSKFNFPHTIFNHFEINLPTKHVSIMILMKMSKFRQ